MNVTINMKTIDGLSSNHDRGAIMIPILPSKAIDT